REWLRLGAVTGAAVLVRPEAGPVLLAALLASIAWSRLCGGSSGSAWRYRQLQALALVAGAWLVVCALRKSAFGEWLPQPVLAKVHRPSLAVLQSGLD